MYKRVLIPLENGPADQSILDHIQKLGSLTGASLILVHIADGWAARNIKGLNLVESQEIQEDRAYLERRATEFREKGFTVETELGMGDPADGIIKISKEKNADLIAMSTHGHKFLGDLIFGSTADKVRHHVDIPVLLLKAKST